MGRVEDSGCLQPPTSIFCFSVLGLWTSGESITEKVANLQLGVHDLFQQRLDWANSIFAGLDSCLGFLTQYVYLHRIYVYYSYPRWTSPSPRANWSLFHTDSHRFQMIYVKTVGNAMLSLVVCDTWWLIFIDQENWIKTPSWWSAKLAPFGLSCPPEILLWARHASFSGA